MVSEENYNKRIFLYVLVGMVAVVFVVVVTVIALGVLGDEASPFNGGNGNGGGNGGNGGGISGFFARFTGYTPDGTGDIYYLGGKVGIGTSTPNYLLEVDGSLDAQSISINGSRLGTSTDSYWSEDSGNIYYNDGYVGIGTITPDYDLEVAGTINAEEIKINGVPVGTSTDSYWVENNGKIYYNTGNVGIGVANPEAKLHIIGNVKIGSGLLEIPTCGGKGLRGIKIGDNSYIYDDDCTGGEQTTLNIDSGDAISLKSGGNIGVYIKKDGKVGIGTNNPGTKLDIGGNLKVGGGVEVIGDVQITDLTSGSSPGTPICFDPDKKLCECGKCAIQENP